MRLVDDQGVVAPQQRVAPDLGQQQAVGHQPHERLLARAVAEAHRVPDGLAERHAQLLGDPLRDGAGGEPARLGVADRAAHAAAELEAQLRQLRGLARARLPRDDDDLMVADRGQQILAPGGDRQLRRIADRRDRGAAPREPGLGGLELALEAGVVLGMAAQPRQPPFEPVLVAQRQLAHARAQVIEGCRHGHGFHDTAG